MLPSSAPHRPLDQQAEPRRDETTAAPATGAAPSTGGSRNRRTDIVHAAQRLFAVRGYRSTSLRDISREVGISHPGVLHYFSSKEALLAAAIDDLEQSTQAVIDRLPEIEASPEGMSALVRHLFISNSQLTLMFAVLSAEAVNPDMPERMRLIRLRRVKERVVEHVITSRTGTAALGEGVDPAWAARTLVSHMLSLMTREATIGAVQPSSAGLATGDFLALYATMCGDGPSAASPAAPRLRVVREAPARGSRTWSAG